jgi:hypothetical protein
MLGSVVQVHLSPPRTCFKKYLDPRNLIRETRVFYCAAVIVIAHYWRPTARHISDMPKMHSVVIRLPWHRPEPDHIHHFFRRCGLELLQIMNQHRNVLCDEHIA